MSENRFGRSNLWPVRYAGEVVDLPRRHQANVLIGGELFELDAHLLPLEPGTPVIVHREESGYMYVADVRMPKATVTKTCDDCIEETDD